MMFPNREENRINSLFSSEGRKKGKIPFQQNEENREISLFNKMKKKGFKKGNFHFPFSKAFWKGFKKEALMTMETEK